MDKSGNLYGTTLIGGTGGYGVVFKVTPSGTETALYSFSDGADGGLPYSTVFMGNHGNLYGTAWSGGAYGGGVVFKLASDGAETVLHAFAGGSDGAGPYAGLIADPALGGHYLYGTTVAGGRGVGGTIFKIKQ